MFQYIFLRYLVAPTIGLHQLMQLFTTIASTNGLAILAYYGFNYSWPWAVGLFAIGIGCKFIAMAINSFFFSHKALATVGLSGFLVIPILGYLIWLKIW